MLFERTRKHVYSMYMYYTAYNNSVDLCDVHPRRYSYADRCCSVCGVRGSILLIKVLLSWTLVTLFLIHVGRSQEPSIKHRLDLKIHGYIRLLDRSTFYFACSTLCYTIMYRFFMAVYNEPP